MRRCRAVLRGARARERHTAHLPLFPAHARAERAVPASCSTMCSDGLIVFLTCVLCCTKRMHLGRWISRKESGSASRSYSGVVGLCGVRACGARERRKALSPPPTPRCVPPPVQTAPWQPYWAKPPPEDGLPLPPPLAAPFRCHLTTPSPTCVRLVAACGAGCVFLPRTGHDQFSCPLRYGDFGEYCTRTWVQP